MGRGSYHGGSTIVGPGAGTVKRRPADQKQVNARKRDTATTRAAATAAYRAKMVARKALRLVSPMDRSPDMAASPAENRMQGVEVLVRKTGGKLIVVKPGKAGEAQASRRSRLGVRGDRE